jgi:hypothetical protein
MVKTLALTSMAVAQSFILYSMAPCSSFAAKENIAATLKAAIF